jgi:hypothetical protein
MNSLRFISSYENNYSSSMAYHPDFDDLRGATVLVAAAIY